MQRCVVCNCNECRVWLQAGVLLCTSDVELNSNLEPLELACLRGNEAGSGTGRFLVVPVLAALRYCGPAIKF